MARKNRITDEEARAVLHDSKRRKEAENVLNDSDKVEELIMNVIKSLDNIPLVGKFFADVPTLCLIVKDYASGEYRGIPVASIVTIVVALIYFVSPIDLVPDFIPVVGKLDDAAVIAIAVGTVHNDLADYKAWKGLDSDKITDVHDIFTE